MTPDWNAMVAEQNRKREEAARRLVEDHMERPPAPVPSPKAVVRTLEDKPLPAEKPYFTDPAKAEALMARVMALPEEAQAVVRGALVAYMAELSVLKLKESPAATLSAAVELATIVLGAVGSRPQPQGLSALVPTAKAEPVKEVCSSCALWKGGDCPVQMAQDGPTGGQFTCPSWTSKDLTEQPPATNNGTNDRTERMAPNAKPKRVARSVPAFLKRRFG